MNGSSAVKIAKEQGGHHLLLCIDDKREKGRKMRRVNPNINSAATAIKRLYKDLKIEPLPGKFHCDYYEECRESLEKRLRRDIITGNWPYIGVDYGKAKISGKVCRILVIAMDQGGAGEARGKDFETRQKEWYGAFFNSVNAHTGGTHLIVKYLVDNKDPEFFIGAFAHTNAVKCSPKKEKQQMKSESTATMRKCCRNHLERELEILKPDLIIAEGKGPVAMVEHILGLSETDYKSYKDNANIYFCKVYRGQPVVLAVPHPARKKGLKWRYGELPSYYLKTIDNVRKIFSR